MVGTANRKTIRDEEDVMSLSNGPAENLGQPPQSAPAAAASQYAPRWIREGRAHPHKVVPLRLPTAPQLVPATSAPAPAAPATPSFNGPDLLAEDVVLKRLLQRHSPDPQPQAVQPVRDPVGLALGMVARLIVAGCAAAAVVMLLIGVIPLPFKFGSAAQSETVSAAVPASAWPPSEPAVSDRVVKSAQRVGDDNGAAAVAPAPPGRIATVSVRAAQPAAADQRALDAAEAERLTKRGEDYLAQGDIAAARLMLARAAEARDARAAFSLATTFDPAVLKELHVRGFRPDLVQARAWYEKAAAYGSAEASRRLGTLPSP
jgi:hypothetical protein